jgi:hypothetical protein
MKTYFVAFFILTSTACSAQAISDTVTGFVHIKTAGLGTVSKVNGVEVYFLCEPFRSYKIIDEVKPLLAAKMEGNTIDGFVGEYVSRAKKKKLQFNALIFNNKWEAYVVQWKD